MNYIVKFQDHGQRICFSQLSGELYSNDGTVLSGGPTNSAAGTLALCEILITAHCETAPQTLKILLHNLHFHI